ncbi:M56 family metallopeptidase [Cellulophaga lytica]|uniref:M56 family metallopeptidase n=1 Tax=Cellulophaga lytica TaxID=979 RepID=UPI000B5CB528|nr:M56 family metallopeptidase [Cellulophaga lytica]SNQ42594.1 Peptidase M56 BlaR1 [Cellulophaga lytica]
MLMYLLKSTACLATLFLFYKLFLEGQNMHKFKRFYLLAALVLSFGIPLITFTTYIQVPIAIYKTPLEYGNINTTETIVEPTNYWFYLIWSIYGLGVLIFSIKFIKNSTNLFLKIKQNPKQRLENHTNVLLTEKTTPHTFLSYIFLNKKAHQQKQIPKEVLLHEITHAKQKHSIDVLLIEVLQVVFWFNPLIYFIKHAIKLNHEFLADQAVLNQGADTVSYRKILLAFSSNVTEPYMANSINYSSIKKRFTVMKKRTSKRSVVLRSLLLIPLAALLFYSFSNQKTEEILVDTQASHANKNAGKGASEKMMQEYRTFFKKYNNAKKKVIDMTYYQRIVSIYDLMTEEQRATVTDHKTILKFPSVDLKNTTKKAPTQSEFNSWKNKENFAIWIDNKHVPNSVLNKYSASDIVHFNNSYVYKNARSAKFPQEHQVNLFTKQGFTNTYVKADVNTYNSILQKYNSELHSFKKNSEISNDDLEIKNVQLKKLYAEFSKEEIKKYNIVFPESIPVKNSEHLGLVIKEEKQDPLETYKKEYNTYVTLTKQEPHYIHRSEAEKKKIDDLFTLLGSIYFSLSKEDRAKVKRVKAPILPYVILIRNGKTEYKKRSELTEDDKKLLPPPPPPPLPPSNNKQDSKELAKARAAFKKDAYEYGSAVGEYRKEGKGTREELNKLYKKTMKSYEKCSALIKKEKGAAPLPPPPPPAPPIKD